MTNERKLEILKLALNEIEKGYEEYMCVAIWGNLTGTEQSELMSLKHKSDKLLMLFGIEKPLDTQDMWNKAWDITRTRRIELLNEAIKKMEGK